MIDVNDSNFEQEVLEAEGLVVLDFGATWCGPCKKLDPIMEDLSSEFDGKAKFGKVDVGVAPGVAQKYRVLSVPQVLFFRDGNVVQQITGLVPKSKLVNKLNEHL